MSKILNTCWVFVVGGYKLYTEGMEICILYGCQFVILDLRNFSPAFLLSRASFAAGEVVAEGLVFSAGLVRLEASGSPMSSRAMSPICC